MAKNGLNKLRKVKKQLERNAIRYVSELGVGIAQKKMAIYGGVKRRTYGTKSFHFVSNWRLNALTEGAATIEMGNLFEPFGERRLSAKTPTWTLQNHRMVTSKPWPYCWNKEGAWIQI